jgi:ABC-type nitrate/sulfonate/bicarbonate transport system permease component
MAETGRLIAAPREQGWVSRHPVTATRILILATILLVWEAIAASGLLYRDIVPSVLRVGAALIRLVSTPAFYFHLYTTFYEIAVAMLIGCLSGLAVGIMLGGSRLLQRAYEPFLYYLGPCPKIIFFPVLIMWFGTGPGSKMAMGVVSCFFPMALNVAGGMREINEVLIRVGRSFRANAWQMATKIYMPAMRHPVINGMRLGLGVCLIGTLLAETKLSDRGIGFLVNDSYTAFDMPQLYALLIVLFVIAIGANALIGRLGGLDAIKRV